MPFCNALMAPTKSTQALTKRQVYIKANPLFFITLVKRHSNRIQPLSLIYAIHAPIRNGGVAGIPWAGNIVFLNNALQLLSLFSKV